MCDNLDGFPVLPGLERLHCDRPLVVDPVGRECLSSGGAKLCSAPMR